jgi:O-antigen/teichoic acid export membrane protein
MTLFKILRNIAALLTGQVVSKFFAFVCVVILARRLGVDGFGLYGTVMAYITLFATFADSGLTTVTVRDVAQDYARSEQYFLHVGLLRTILTVVAYLLMLLLGSVWKAEEFSVLFIASCGLFLFPEAFRKLGISLLTAYERMDIVALLDVVAIMFRYVPFFLAIWLGRSLHFAFLLLVVAWVGVAIIWMFIIRKYCLKRWLAPVQRRQLWDILYAAYPFGIFLVLSVIYFKADILMLAKMQGKTAVGLYEGAYNFISASMFIPVSIINVLLPVMSRNFVTDKVSCNAIYVHASRLMAMCVLPAVIGVSFFSREIILLVYKDAAYLPSASALSLLIWALFFIFINAPVWNTMASSNMVHAFLPYAVGNTLLNIVLNFFLIPRYSFLGASFATVFTEFTGFALQLWFANRILGNAPEIIKILGKLVVVGGITSAAFALIKTSVIFPLNVFISLAVYLLCLFIFQVIGPEDKQVWRAFTQMVRSKLTEKSQ